MINQSLRLAADICQVDSRGELTVGEIEQFSPANVII